MISWYSLCTHGRRWEGVGDKRTAWRPDRDLSVQDVFASWLSVVALGRCDESFHLTEPVLTTYWSDTV